MAQDSTGKPIPEGATPSAEDTQKMFGQAVVTSLIALTLFALSFFYFVWKQNHELNELLIRMGTQSKNAQSFDRFYNNFVYDLSIYSQQHPEVLQMLTQSGVDVAQQTGRPAHQELAPLPPPPAP